MMKKPDFRRVHVSADHRKPFMVDGRRLDAPLSPHCLSVASRIGWFGLGAGLVTLAHLIESLWR